MEMSLKSRLKGGSRKSEDREVDTSSSTINSSNKKCCDVANNNPLLSNNKIKTLELVNQESSEDSVFYSCREDNLVTHTDNRSKALDIQTLAADNRKDVFQNAALAADNCIIVQEKSLENHDQSTIETFTGTPKLR